MRYLGQLAVAALVASAAMPFQAKAGSVGVYVGYADGLRGGADFPSPFAIGGTFAGATVTQFVGNLSGSPDSGAVMLINTGSSAVTINGLSVNDRANGGVYNIWAGQIGAGITLGVNEAAIFAENSGNNFDTSDYGGNTGVAGAAGFNPDSNNCSTGPLSLTPSCTNNSPIVTFTLNSTATDFFDSAHVLDTGGYDSANYVHHHTGGSGTSNDNTNESLNWRPIGTTGVNDPGGGPAAVPEPATLALFGFSLAGIGVLARRRKHV